MSPSIHDEAQHWLTKTATRLSHPAPVQATVGLLVGDKRWLAGGADNDIYEIGSVTKVFTTTLLSIMVEQGALRLDHAVSAHVPEIHVDERITLAHLATHTSGLPRVPKELLKNLDRSNPYARFDEDALLRCLDGLKLPRPPGERHQYSNLGAALLGHALARRAGLSYDALLQHQLCSPLGLGDTAIHLTPLQHKRLAPAHTSRGRPSSHWDLASFAPAGALKSTTCDLLNFIAAQFDGSHPLSHAFERARMPHDRRRFVTMGLGWFLSPLGATTEVWHTGGTGGAASYLGFVPDKEVGVVVLVNRALSLYDALLRNRVEHAGRKLLKQICALPANLVNEPKTLKFTGESS